MAQPCGTSDSVRFDIRFKTRSLRNDRISEEDSAEDLQTLISFTVLLTARFTRIQLQRQLSYVALRFCVALLLVVPLQAQKTSGTIRGLVTDPSGAVVPSTVVVIRSDETGSTRT